MSDIDFTLDLSRIATAAAQIAVIIVVALVALWLMRKAIRKIITARIPKLREESAEQLSSRSDTLASVISRSLSFVVWAVAFIMILSAVGINTAPIIAAVGLAGLAVGFAAQNIIRDYFHGFFIVMEDWFRVNEIATLAGETGLVVEMGLRRTVLRDLNGTMHVIPNGKIEVASNRARDWARINLDVSVAYKEDLDKVIQVTNEVCQQLQEDEIWGSDLLTTPKVERVDSLGDSGIDIKILGDTKPARQWAVMGELRRRLKDRYDAEDIEIPWPHTKVYFGNAPVAEPSPN